ncbi:MAG: hypothetical protein ABII93_01620 [Chrysiogenia bacterium]
MRLRVLVLMVALLGTGLYAGDPAALETVAVPAAEGAASGAEAAVVKDGYSLLNSLLTLFEDLPVVKVKKGEEGQNKVANTGIAEVDNRLSQLSMDAKATLNAGLIDKIFYNRYQRMLTIFKMIITPIIRNEMLKNLFMKEFADFVWNVTYEQWSWEESNSIPKMAAAMEEEFVQMQFYLDSRQARDEFKKKIGKRILPPPPPSAKKKLEDKKSE